MKDREIIKKLKSLSNPKNIEGMIRFGINPKNTYGVSLPVLRKMAKQFDKTQFAYSKAFTWTKRKEEFVKRAGFVMMACLSVYDKEANNKKFEQFFPIIKREADDQRNFVRKAVNWALRQIGKRNLVLNKKAIAVAKQIQKMESKSAQWIANNALKELTSEAVQERLVAKKMLK